MSKMTDKEIIKALECCIKPTSDCDNCSLYVKGDGDCVTLVKQGALDLINRQQAEIEMLNAENTLATSERNAFQKSFYAIVRENRRLKADLKEIGIEYERLDDEVTNGIEVCHECHEKYDKKIKQTKAEAIKEFDRKIKIHAYYIDFPKRHRVVDEEDIDNLVKEMVGEGK